MRKLPITGAANRIAAAQVLRAAKSGAGYVALTRAHTFAQGFAQGARQNAEWETGKAFEHVARAIAPLAFN